MSGQLQLRRGTTIENDAFTGVEGELTYDTQMKELRIHDGATQGGAGIIDPIVAFQVPTADNGYTWYRKYASGWVEQGGLITNATTYTLPVAMIDTNYYVNICWDGGKSNYFYPIDYQVRNLTTTTFYTTACRNGSNVQGRCWEVKGMAAE